MSTRAQDATLRHSRANNAFGLSLFSELRLTRQDQNVFFSPASVSIALGLLYTGARDKTLSELASVLGLADAGLVDRNAVLSAYKSLVDVKSPNATLDIASTVLIKQSAKILDQYKCDAAWYFHAQVRSVDFLRDGSKVAAEINEWVSGKTKGKIPRLLGGALPGNTVAYLINAVYFKGTWLAMFRASETKGTWLAMFRASETKPMPFYNHGRDEVKVPTMSVRRTFSYAYLEAIGASALAIPYAGDRFSMIIVLPSSRTGLPNVEHLLTVEVLEKLANDLVGQDVTVLLPKFNIETDYDLVSSLRKLGLESAFDSPADLSGISLANDLMVSDVKPKALIEVNEEGTVAAGVTSVRVKPKSFARSLPRPPPTFHVDPPFLFSLWDREPQRALFLGALPKL
uniref:Lospin 2 n=1 Tax=Amblyomma americanum TaxID=6943 RepID=A7UI17_AMBAM|nr:lospin 2 [Amblyomma americanum]